MGDMRHSPETHFRTVELRASDNGAGFEGYASHFWSVDSYWEAVKPGAFKKTIKERGTRFPVLNQHDPSWPIGRLTDIKEDKTGLAFNASISEGSTHGRDVMALLRDGVPLGMSFGFVPVKRRQATDDDPLTFDHYQPKREDVTILEEAKLMEVSVVTFPANEQAEILDVRAAAEADALTSLLAHIRAGSLSDEHRALMADLVAAFNDAEPEPPVGTPLPDANARHRHYDVELALAAARQQGWIPWE